MTHRGGGGGATDVDAEGEGALHAGMIGGAVVEADFEGVTDGLGSGFPAMGAPAKPESNSKSTNPPT